MARALHDEERVRLTLRAARRTGPDVLPSLTPYTRASFPRTSTIAVMDTALDLRAVRQAAINGNVANAETPGYQARELDFEASLRAARQQAVPMRRTHSGHLVGRPRPSEPVWLEEGPVDLVREMTRMSENTGAYGSTATLLKERLDALLAAVRNGGR